MLPFYKPELIGLDGLTIKTIDDCISVQAARSFNTDGSATIVVPDYYAPALFRMHTRMKLWRHDYDGIPHNFGQTIWFLKKADRDYSARTISLSFVDAFAMLRGRLVGYTADGTYANKTLEEYHIDTFDNRLRTDNMMRAYVRENMGSLALDGARFIASLEIEADKNLGAYGEKQAAWAELGATLSDLARISSAKGVDLYYDLFPRDDGTFLFKVWKGLRGLDRGSASENPLVLTEESGLIADVHGIDDWTEVASFGYVLGFDTGGSQVIREVENQFISRGDPFGRIETTVNVADTDVDSVLDDAGIAALVGKRARRIITCKVVENSSLSFGRDLDYGDSVVVQVGGQAVDCILNTSNVTWQDGEEELDLRLRGETFSDERPVALWLALPNPSTNPENLAPVVIAGVDQSVALAMTMRTAGSVTDDGLPDPPGDVTFGWTMTSGPGTATFADVTQLTTDVTFDVAGVYVLRLTANDGELEAFDEMTATVVADTDNQPPMVSAGDDQTLPLSGTLHTDGAVSDDGLPDPPADVNYLWTKVSGPGVVTFLDDTQLTTDVIFSHIGTYVLRLTANDGELTAFDEMTVIVTADETSGITVMQEWNGNGATTDRLLTLTHPLQEGDVMAVMGGSKDTGFLGFDQAHIPSNTTFDSGAFGTAANLYGHYEMIRFNSPAANGVTSINMGRYGLSPTGPYYIVHLRGVAQAPAESGMAAASAVMNSVAGPNPTTSAIVTTTSEVGSFVVWMIFSGSTGNHIATTTIPMVGDFVLTATDTDIARWAPDGFTQSGDGTDLEVTAEASPGSASVGVAVIVMAFNPG